MNDLAMIRVLLPRFEGRGRLGRAGEFVYLWFNVMAAFCLLSIGAGAIQTSIEPREIVAIWVAGVFVLRLPALLGCMAEAGARAALPLPAPELAAPPKPAAFSRSAKANDDDGYVGRPKEASAMTGARRAGPRGRIVGRS